MQETYTTETVCRVTGVEERTLRSWHLRASLITEAEASGKADGQKWRRYTLSDVLRIAIIVKLIESGLKAGDAIELTKTLQREPDSTWLVIQRKANGVPIVRFSVKDHIEDIFHLNDLFEKFPVSIVVSVAFVRKLITQSLGASA